MRVPHHLLSRDRMSRASGLWAALLVAGCQPAAVAPVDPDAPPSHVTAPQPRNVVAAVERLREFSHLRRALAQTGLAPALSRRPAVTLLAPRDTAFAQLGPERMQIMFDPANRPALNGLMRQLMIPRILRADELRQLIDAGGGSVVIAGDGGPLTFTRQGEQLYVTAPGGKASMGTQEMTTDNGAVYVLDHWIGG